MSMRAKTAEHPYLHVARRNVASSLAPFPGAGPVRASLPDAHQPVDAFPIWFAVLMASCCLAQANGENRAIRWDCISGRAVYTNQGGDAEHIEPLGVRLLGGETLAVCWMPGETAYTVEVYGQNERCA